MLVKGSQLTFYVSIYHENSNAIVQNVMMMSKYGYGDGGVVYAYLMGIFIYQWVRKT